MAIDSRTRGTVNVATAASQSPCFGLPTGQINMVQFRVASFSYLVLLSVFYISIVHGG